ncbi:putative telomere silencing protein Zds1 [Aspergillus clavatus NRRL 1]|uniref:Telomere silencing protein Zds1, putative n=1 Tax=Aspergillus clavatus (strain ATCC 1007 / CBS 513.65 / DSM 816 / NCTC 3887 / NRRL 1 / QM 1276 / 107) TaxID=344612 RepID=A1CTF2_ASPCL|nr:telomere silencing protein Zds1, putative [Aspergillus clavatus NRRL 1]EAW06589.1 telomere silencing protein Zds1, putative [Aspergillus clavatus NRRL 1]
MQASTSPSETGRGYATRRGHVPQLSISDPSHHVTEAIGHMYEDDYDRQDPNRLSFLSSPVSENISIIPPSLAGSENPSSPQSLQVQNHLNTVNNRQANGQPSRPPLNPSQSFDRESSSPTSPGSTDTATTSFPLNDIDYESNPAAVAQELSNLAAIRRMSMDVAAAGDPDLPSYGSNVSVPSIAPSPSADENDASRLFWVPARLHPELAPKEFKSFLEGKAEQIHRKSGEFSPSGFEREGSAGSLRRKKSMLSRQIDNSQGYTDGAERLERKRSQTTSSALGPNLLQLESLVDDSKEHDSAAAPLVNGVQKFAISTDDDMPILPPAPPGHSLRRSTRTQYRKAGSLRKGEKLPYSKRVAKPSELNDRVPSIITTPADEPTLGLTRVATDPAPTTKRAQAEVDAPDESTRNQAKVGSEKDKSRSDTDPSGIASAPPHGRHAWHSRISSNGRSTLNLPPTEQRVPEIIETPPAESDPVSTTPTTPTTPKTPTFQSSHKSGLDASYDASPGLPGKDSPVQAQDVKPSKRSASARQIVKEGSKTLNDLANNPQPLPGNTMRTDSLSFIPTMTEDRKPETKKSKDKKESDGGRKSSWHWLLGSEEKEKEKDTKKKDKDNESKRSKSKSVDKTHQSVHTSSTNEISPRGRESITPDRLDPKLEEERRKDSVRRTSGESKKDKESGLFSSIFGGGRKKNSGDSHHKKSASRTLSPEPPAREQRPDVDYPWTRFSILEERAIYRMAHIKLANPRRALYSQVLLSNFMYSYLAKVQQMHPHMMLASSGSQRQQQQPQQQQQQHSRDQPEEYSQYQRYQEFQSQQEQQHYNDSSYDDPQMYEYNDDPRDAHRPHSRGSKYENGNAYGPGHHQHGHSAVGDDAQLDDDDDEMW